MWKYDLIFKWKSLRNFDIEIFHIDHAVLNSTNIVHPKICNIDEHVLIIVMESMHIIHSMPYHHYVVKEAF